ncbi:unnamed protein product [Prorocentrum cordatum]|uniref:Tyr recombinase domain-containing protein n=1 Tax=Prorocentrum cordatum TaxID=2364126 RepID=A0ABN9RGU1_9DINO|nr:unnamed protein product [Polarella glacialis]
MILDARAVNQESIDPDTTALPSVGVWRGLKTPASHRLSLGQVDTEAAFRTGVPPGLDEMFGLPAAPVDALLEALPEVDIGSRLEGKVSPLLAVLPIGWSWSLYFCQALAVHQVVAAGIRANRIIQDRRVVPDVSETAGVAVHVDGAAAIGCDPVSVSTTIEQVHQHLEASHLKCKGAQSDPRDQKFTGLSFDFETGRISVSKGRIWRLLLALLEVAGRGYCSGDGVLSLLGHNAWAAILRWPPECRVAAALIAFAYLGAKLGVDPVVLATDASTGSGDLEGTGFGGYAVTEKTWTRHDVWAAASCMERWRYKFEGAIETRRRAFQAARELEREGEARELTGVTGLVEDPEMSDTVLPLQSEGSTRMSSAAQPARRVSSSVEHQVNFEEIDPSFSDGRHAGQLGADEARGLAALALARACGEATTWRNAGGARFLGEVEEREQPGRDLTAERAAQPNGDQEGPLGDASGVEHRLSLSSDSSSTSDTESSGTARHGDVRGDVKSGLTFLQTNKVKPLTRAAFRERAQNFLEWAIEGALAEISTRRLDQLATNYVDVLFFGGMEVGEGSRLLAALQYLRPSLGTARRGNFPVARAAVAGFRRRARGGARDSLCRPWALAAVGVSLLLEDLEFATALRLAWDGMLRLPSDLVGVMPKTLIGPGRAAKPAWALLLYPSEEEARGKVMGADEGAILREASWRGGGSVALRRLRGARGPSCQLWSFDGAWFTKRFEERLAALPEAPAAVAYQVRHGVAIRAAAGGLPPLSGITEQLRHGNPHSILRYAKHDRYLALLNRAPQAAVDWSEAIHARLGGLLGGADVLQAPAFLPQSVLEALRASCAKASHSGVNKRVKFPSKLDSRRVR